MLSCCELQERLSVEKSIDKVQEKQIRKEANCWYQVFEQLVATIQVLAERNFPFCGPDEHIVTPHNGTFLVTWEV